MIIGKEPKTKEGYQEEIFEFFKITNKDLEILDCNACHINPEILTIRNYLEGGRTQLLGIKIICPKCSTSIKSNHSGHLIYDSESTTAKQLLGIWNLKMKGNNNASNRWCI